MSFKSFNWLKDGLLPLSLAIMIVCWLSPWVLWVGTWSLFADQRPMLSPLAMAAILVVSTFLTKVLLKQDWPMESVQAIISGLGLVAILLSVGIEHYQAYFFLDPRWLGALFWDLNDIFAKGLPPQLVGMALGAYLWWRGIALGRESVEFDAVFGGFRLGIILLVGLLVLSLTTINTAGFADVQAQAIPAVLAFFFFSLLALSLSRLETVREEAKRREGKALGFNRDWLVAVVVSIVAIVLLGFIVSSIFSFDLASRLLGVLVSVAELLMIPLLALAIVFGFVAQYLIFFLQWLIRVFHVAAEQGEIKPPENPFMGRDLGDSASSGIPQEIIQALQWAITIAIVAFAVFLFVKAIARLRRQTAEEDVEETHESLWSWAAFVDEVSGWLRALWHRLVGRRTRAVIRNWADSFQTDPQYQVSLSIRQVYRSLLSYASRLGVPKPPDATPYEYLDVLTQTWPLGREDLLAITEAYVQVRYSGQPARATEFALVSDAWSRLQAMLRTMAEDEGKRSGALRAR